MTLIAGIYSRIPDRSVPEDACLELLSSISRNPQDKPDVFNDGICCLVKLDIGAFGGSASWNAETGAITLVTGEPLFDSNDQIGRQAETTAIHRAMQNDDVVQLRKANGVFSICHYDPLVGRIILATDKLGIRPVYYWKNDEFVIFASALRILEKVTLVPKRMDVRAITALVGLGYSLGSRTPFADISLLKPAEMVTISGQTTVHKTYWDWYGIETQNKTETEFITSFDHTFKAAVARRSQADTSTAAYLSGGLDSRCIIAALRDACVNVHSFNFSRPGTQDQVFGREFADAIGSKHREQPKVPGDLVPDYSQLMADAWKLSAEAERPGIVWSGEGGSVAVGHVHISEDIVAAMRSADIDSAIAQYLTRESAEVSPRIFLKQIAAKITRSIPESCISELSSNSSADSARTFYLFLLLNDQHRKLARHFENIDLHRIEFQLPFFDSKLIELLVSMPIDICLRHSFYVKWLSKLPAAVTSVPWQAYPGHELCPIKVKEELANQWESGYQSAEHAARQKIVSAKAKEMLSSVDFPSFLLNKTNLRMAAWVNATGLRDYQYLIGPAHTYFQYSQRTGGQNNLSELL